MHAALLNRLSKDDDAELWDRAIDSVIENLHPVPGTCIQVGSCSHWQRPHGWFWAAGGGFAMPVGYGNHKNIPELDWSIYLLWDGQNWLETAKPAPVALRIALPSRTANRIKAAIHTIWSDIKKPGYRFYGFRKSGGQWKLTAASQDQWEAQHSRHDERKKSKKASLARRTVRISP